MMTNRRHVRACLDADRVRNQGGLLELANGESPLRILMMCSRAVSEPLA